MKNIDFNCYKNKKIFRNLKNYLNYPVKSVNWPWFWRYLDGKLALDGKRVVSMQPGNICQLASWSGPVFSGEFKQPYTVRSSLSDSGQRW